MTGEPTEGTVPTLGERLAAQGRALAARNLPAFPWAGPLAVATQRGAALDTAHEQRFTRVEVDPDTRRPPRPAAPRRPTPGPVRPVSAPPGLGEWARSVSGGADADVTGEVGVGPAVAAPTPADPSAPAAAPVPPGRPVEPLVRERLRIEVGSAADLVRVHDDPGADALARRHGADAVTLGTDVHFREGGYRPADRHGFGLLVHEAGHVAAALEPAAALRRSTGPGRAEEERRVAGRERAAVTRSGPPPPPAGVVAPPTHDAIAPAMAAPVGRDVDPTPAAEPATALAAQLASLRRELVDDVLGDLRRQLRVEFERGG